jgi:ubiquinone biosynthesis protein UbiJ
MKGAHKGIRHLGPVAEDFYKAFPLGLGNTTIGMGDIDGVNLAAAKALEARTTVMQRELKAKDAEIAKLRSKSADLEARLARLEALLQARK